MEDLEQGKLLERLIASSVDGVLAFDHECRYTVWNPGMERISGVPAAEALGRVAFDVFPFLVEIGEDAHFHAVMAGQTVVADDRPFSVPGTGREGFFEAHYSPLRDERGLVVGGLGMIRDITERKNAERALLDREERLSLALDASRLAVWEWDVAEDRVTWSPELFALFEVDPETFSASYEGFLASVHPDDVERTMATVSETLAGRGCEYELEHRIKALDQLGQPRWVRGRARVLRDETGAPRRMLGTVLDISEQRRLQEELLRAQRVESVGRLAGGVAHDFNNLLTVITGFGELIKLKAREAEVSGWAEELLRAAKRGADLSQQLLTFARKQVVQPRVVDVNAFLLEARGLLGRLIGAHVELICEPSPARPQVRIDPGQLQQVLVNLVVNARDALEGAGQISVSAGLVEASALGPGHEGAPEWVTIRVTDTGGGIAPEVQRLIFEPFFTTKPPGEGSGLGLSICFGIVGQAGGRIEVRSSPGAGTTVQVELPSAGAERAEEARAEAPEAQGGSERILLVEDEAQVRKIAALVLRTRGYEVLEAEHGEGALELLAGGGEVELVITDMVMPRMGGAELARRLAQRVDAPPVLFSSGYAAELELLRADSQAGVDFIQKPYAPQELLERVREVLDRAPRSLGR